MLKLSKALARVLVLALAVTPLAACQSTPAETTPPDQTASSAGSSPGEESSGGTESGWVYQEGGPVSPENVTVSVLTHSGHAPTLAIPNNDLPVYAAIEERLGVTFDWQIVESAAYKETINVRLMSKDLPDMVVPTARDQIARLVEDNFFLSYDDLDYEANAPYSQKLFADPDYSNLMDIYRSIYSDGKLYSFGCTVVPRFLFRNHLVNVTWLENLGLDEPETLEEFYEMLVAFRDNDPNGNGQADEIPMATTSEMPTVFGHAFSIDVTNGWSLDENGKIISEYVTDKYRDYLQYRARLYAENLVDREKRDMTANYELVAQDRLGAIDYFATFSKTISGYSPYADENISSPVFRELLPLQNVYTGERSMYARLTTGEGEGMYILSAANNPEVCLRVADWLWASEEYDVLRTFGIEGMSYEITADGQYSPIQPDDYDGAVTYLASIGGGQPPFAYRQIELGWRNVNPAWVIERADAIKPCYIDGLQPWVLTSAESEELAKYTADITTFRDEWSENFINGVTSFDKWQDYIDGMYALGLDRQTELYQKKYDAL